MSFHRLHGTLPEAQPVETFFDFYKNFIRIESDKEFIMRAEGQLSDASIVKSFLKNQTFEFQATGRHLEFSFDFTGHDCLGLANKHVRNLLNFKF